MTYFILGICIALLTESFRELRRDAKRRKENTLNLYRLLNQMKVINYKLKHDTSN